VADLRCPMCSKPNPEEADVCAFCGARLKPVLAGSPPAAADQGLPPMPDWLSRLRAPEDEPPATQEPSATEGEGDWLARLRATDPQWSSSEWEPGAATPSAPSAPPAPGGPARSSAPVGEGPDWLSRLREASSEETGPPVGEVPSWLAEAEPGAPAAASAPAMPESDGDVPEWLARVRAKREEDGGDEPIDSDAIEGVLPDVFNLEKTGWHSGLTGLLIEPAGEPPADSLPTAAPVWLEPESPGEEQPLRTGQLPERRPRKPVGVEPEDGAPAAESPRSTGRLADEKPPRPMGSFAPLVPGSERAEPPARSTGRLSRLAAAAREALAPTPAATPPAPPQEAAPPARSTGRLASLAAAASESATPPSAAPPPPTPPFGIGDLGDETGLSSLIPAAEEPPSQPTRPPAVLPTTTEAEKVADVEAGKSDWLKELEQPAPEPQAPPAHAPALVLQEGETAEFDLGSVDVPEWLTDAGAMPSEAAIAPEARPDLAPATLPTWLEAMRPVDTFRSVVEILPEDEQAVESAGPLAGLRGVLMAEPVVSLPRITGVGSTRLSVTERQVAQAELLQKLVQDELRELPAVTRGRARLPILRWAIGGLLLLAVALPILLRLSIFALPTVEPIELGHLVDLVAGLPADRAVLLVFDYEPANAGELEVVAGPLLEDLMSKGYRLATVSTRPTGPPLAERLVRQRGEAYDYQNGVDYVHLGYLSGGVPAIQLFAADPRAAILSGFAASADADGGLAAGWNSPLFEGVRSLSDFGMVAVITAGTETARAWTEQASPWLAGRPLVMVLSAGVEPMIRPYYEALTPQVNGLLSGEPAAVAYELRNGKPGPAVARWNPFCMGILVVEILLACGGIYGVGAWLVQAFRPRPKAKRP
jgi:hypothetical protein